MQGKYPQHWALLWPQEVFDIFGERSAIPEMAPTASLHTTTQPWPPGLPSMDKVPVYADARNGPVWDHEEKQMVLCLRRGWEEAT